MNLKKTKDIAEYLYGVFGQRTVFALNIETKGTSITHFLVFMKDAAHDKSISFQRGQLHQIRWDLGRITQQKVKERGQAYKNMWGLRPMCLIKLPRC